ncbi:ECF transporter S component [Mycoplasmopsis hyopharyngis]|uniref:ECF transporter S component n=1 Tax=Mycoplasmopsis hyopharyngis TaxID=29558 RepID=UPI003872ED4E
MKNDEIQQQFDSSFILKSVEEEKKLEQKLKKQEVKKYFIRLFKFNSLEIAISGMLLAIQLITMYISKMTILKVIPIEIEFLFYILYGPLIGPIKGALLAFLGDTLTMLINGTIGQWYYGYSLVSIAIPIISYLFVLLFKKNKYAQIIMPITIIVIGLTIAALTLFYFSKDGQIALKGSRKNKYGNSPISIKIVIGMMAVYTIIGISACLAFFVIYQKTKKEKWKNYLLIFSLIIFILIIFRWAFGSMLYIDYYNKIIAPKSKNPMVLKDHYLTFMYPIVIKSLFTIPIYTLIATPVFNIVEILKEKYIEKNYQITH